MPECQQSWQRPLGVIGLGNMGQPIARSLLAAGAQLVVYDEREPALAALERDGAVRASAPHDFRACAAVAVIVASAGPGPLSDDERVIDAADWVVPHMRPGATLIIHSTVRPATVAELADRARAQRVDVIDAPVSGGDFNAARGDLTVMVGGDASVLERCRRQLEAIGRVHHVGPIGTGSALKLINNLMQAGHFALACEALQLAAAHQIPERRFREIVGVSSGACWTMDHLEHLDHLIFDHTLARDPRIAEIFSKDSWSAMVTAHEAGVRIPLVALVQELLPEVVEQRRDTIRRRQPHHV